MERAGYCRQRAAHVPGMRRALHQLQAWNARKQTHHAIVDRHMLFVVYAAMREEAKTFFRYLKSILELKEVANQDIVLVELIAVWLMEGRLLPPES